MEEIWLDIEGFEGFYQVSNKGKIKSLSRLIPSGRGRFRRTKEKILSPGIVGKGYLQVHLAKNGVITDLLVSRIVAKAFIPNPEGLPEVNHKNGDKSDCSAENLEWTDHKGNMEHALRTGLMPDRRGENGSAAVLNNDEAVFVRKRHEAGESIQDLADKLEVGYMVIYKIVKRQTFWNV